VAKSDGQRFGRSSTLPPSVQDRIAADHRAGVSLAQIARDLTAARVPTACGYPRWYPSSVQSALRSIANDRLAGLA